MKDPNLSTSSGTNVTLAGEVILSNQFGSEENPFAEYMWMENEEEFNRQVSRFFFFYTCSVTEPGPDPGSERSVGKLHPCIL